MNRPFQTLCTIFIAALCYAALLPEPAMADDMVLFKNGRTIRADDLEQKKGVYRITTMSGGVMEVPVQLVERVIPCVVDKEVEEARGADPATPPPSDTARTGRSTATRIPPAGSRAAKGAGKGAGVLGSGKAAGKGGKEASVIPPRGGNSLGNPGSRVRKPPAKGAGGKK